MYLEIIMAKNCPPRSLLSNRFFVIYTTLQASDNHIEVTNYSIPGITHLFIQIVLKKHRQYGANELVAFVKRSKTLILPVAARSGTAVPDACGGPHI
jgi:hypothetical protein